MRLPATAPWTASGWWRRYAVCVCVCVCVCVHLSVSGAVCALECERGRVRAGEKTRAIRRHVWTSL